MFFVDGLKLTPSKSAAETWTFTRMAGIREYRQWGTFREGKSKPSELIINSKKKEVYNYSFIYMFLDF